MSARAVSKYTQKLTGGVGAVFLRFLGPDDRRIIMSDSDDEWWHDEARRGHRPHGASRRRARSSTGRVCGRREVAMLVDRERRAHKMQVSQVRGAKQDVPKRESPPGQCPGPRASQGHRPCGDSRSGAKYEAFTGSAMRTRNTRRSEITDHSHVTSVARVSCELAS